MHFCVSLSWRVLQFYLDEIPSSEWKSASLGHANEAEIVWREFLLHRRAHPGRFQQHILPLDRIEDATFQLPPNINRYLTRAIDMDICWGRERTFVYSKIGRFVFLGFVNEPDPNHWIGTKVNVSEGVIEPQKYTLPRVFGEFLNSKADRVASRLESISDVQKKKIEESFRGNLDRYIESDAFRAMSADVSIVRRQGVC